MPGWEADILGVLLGIFVVGKMITIPLGWVFGRPC